MTSTSARVEETATQKPVAAASGGDAPQQAKPARRKSVAQGRQKGSPEARRTAAALLEVLGGERKPADAASALGISLMRYYVVESRALEGLIAACEARPAGHPVDPDRTVARLTRELEQLRHTAARYQAMARAAHRALGIVPVRPAVAKPDAKGVKRRRRATTVRALKAARELRRSASAGAQASDQAAASAQSALAAHAVP